MALNQLAEWVIAVRNTAEASPNTVAVRRGDVTPIAEGLAEVLERC